MGILAWIVVGLVAGWLASQVMRGGGYGLIGDIIVGIVGAVIGGFLAATLLEHAGCRERHQRHQHPGGLRRRGDPDCHPAGRWWSPQDLAVRKLRRVSGSHVGPSVGSDVRAGTGRLGFQAAAEGAQVTG